jgi:hypothetical protein
MSVRKTAAQDAALQEWLRTATRRYLPQHSNTKTLERTQSWKKTGARSLGTCRRLTKDVEKSIA